MWAYSRSEICFLTGQHQSTSNQGGREMSTRILLTRHEDHKNNQLLPEAFAQAVERGKKLKDAGFKIDGVICSPQWRCVETCLAILQGYGTMVPLTRVEPHLGDIVLDRDVPDGWLANLKIAVANKNANIVSQSVFERRIFRYSTLSAVSNSLIKKFIIYFPPSRLPTEENKIRDLFVQLLIWKADNPLQLAKWQFFRSAVSMICL